MPDLSIVRCSSPLRYESDTIARGLQCFSYRFCRFEELLGDGRAPLGAFNSRILRSDRFAVPWTRFV